MYSFESKLAVLKTNSVYRVNDVFIKGGIRWREDRDEILSNDVYKNTILRKYLEKEAELVNYDLLRNIILEHGELLGYKKPMNNELVFHFRLGDLMMKDYNFKALKNKIKNFFKQIEIIEENNIEKVSLVTALHFGANDKNGKFFFSEQSYANSIECIELFRNLLVQKTGMNMNLVSNKEVDKDLYYLTTAKHYVPTLRGFSELIKKLLQSDSIIYNIN